MRYGRWHFSNWWEWYVKIETKFLFYLFILSCRWPRKSIGRTTSANGNCFFYRSTISVPFHPIALRLSRLGYRSATDNQKVIIFLHQRAFFGTHLKRMLMLWSWLFFNSVQFFSRGWHVFRLVKIDWWREELEKKDRRDKFWLTDSIRNGLYGPSLGLYWIKQRRSSSQRCFSEHECRHEWHKNA